MNVADKVRKQWARLSDAVEDRLVGDILSGKYEPGQGMPLERDLAEELGVGRPTLREALGRMERDGWITVRKGQATRVNDYWREGNLNVISKVVQLSDPLPGEFILHLLQLRAVLAPAYVRDAVASDPARVVAALVGADELPPDALAFAEFDWRLQKCLARLSPNPVYVLIMNSFDPVYVPLAGYYFADERNREASRHYYGELMRAAMQGDHQQAAEIVSATMNESLDSWRRRAAEKAGQL